MATARYQSTAVCTVLLVALVSATPIVIQGDIMPTRGATGSRRQLRVVASPMGTQANTTPGATNSTNSTSATAPAGSNVITVPAQQAAQQAAPPVAAAAGTASVQVLQGATGAAQPDQSAGQQALTALSGAFQGASTLLQNKAVTGQGQSGADARTAGYVLQSAGSVLIKTRACLECQQQCKAAGGEVQGTSPVCTKPTDVIDKCVCVKKAP